MTLTDKQLEEYLMVYGTDIDKWAESLQAEALCAPSIDALIIRQQYVDEMLSNCDVMPPHSPDLSARIIRKARSIKRKVSFNIMDWLAALFADFSLPQPAYVVAAIVLLGLGIGVINPDPYSDNGVLEQASLADDGAAL